MKLPGVVYRGVQSWDYCEYEDQQLLGGRIIEVPVWLFTLCVFRGHVFKYCADGRLTSASDDEVRQVLDDDRPSVIREVMHPFNEYGAYDDQVARVLRAIAD